VVVVAVQALAQALLAVVLVAGERTTLQAQALLTLVLLAQVVKALLAERVKTILLALLRVGAAVQVQLARIAPPMIPAQRVAVAQVRHQLLRDRQ